MLVKSITIFTRKLNTLKNLLCIAKILFTDEYTSKEQDARLMQRRNLWGPTLQKFRRVPRRHLTTAKLSVSKVKSFSVAAVGTLNWILCDSRHRRVKWHTLDVSLSAFDIIFAQTPFNLLFIIIARYFSCRIKICILHFL